LSENAVDHIQHRHGRLTCCHSHILYNVSIEGELKVEFDSLKFIRENVLGARNAS
jgi:hypothetical protein